MSVALARIDSMKIYTHASHPVASERGMVHCGCLHTPEANPVVQANYSGGPSKHVAPF
jgi:hypothetical protein